MKQRLLASLTLVCGVGACGAADFAPPVRLKADGVAIRVEAPGYACPCWADIDGKSKNDLLVGQFRGGKIKIYKNLGDSKFAAGEWLKAGGSVAEVPGVW